MRSFILFPLVGFPAGVTFCIPADDLQLRSMDFRTPHPADTLHLDT